MSIEAIKRFIESNREAVSTFNKKKAAESFNGLNIFEMVSDIYHRENMHSDVLQVLLAPSANHGENDKYLKLFMEFISKKSSYKIELTQWGTNIIVSREEGRRDITILENNKAVIIENKINDAGDTTNQIPTYYYQLKSRKIEVVAIVYLTLNQGKEPDRTTWELENESDKLDIENKLICIRAFDGTSSDLISGWLTPCIKVTTDSNNIAVLVQYKAILQKLTKELLDMDFMDSFAKQLEQEHNFNTAVAIKENIDKLPDYIGLKFKNYFAYEEKYNPFKGARMYNGIPYFENFEVAGYCFNSDVIFSLDTCVVDFSVRNKEICYTKETPKKILELIDMLSEFRWNNKSGRYEHIINENIIKSEKMAIVFVEEFLNKLRAKKEVIKSELSKI
ncbi:PD-(D/E)XK nuclease family protein [Plebeiibacterium sediminum]|uniref:PD-(D/E)XK nuclease family protein n=1 Tax=Plebeiibacterium sediminum TaxID=2992112 RepID=A0AAE3M8P2_9BACT|nr:PD-(D/E)XK nuclease family protein [Plebeiobacterium sediminum]MCW3789284.1 PD-(D/E)XK nuclease family protein [Plebeiobacterium sediminum]